MQMYDRFFFFILLLSWRSPPLYMFTHQKLKTNTTLVFFCIKARAVFNPHPTMGSSGFD